MAENKDEKALFLNATGTRLQYHTIRLIVLGHSRKSNLSEKITTHSFRRSCATELIRADQGHTSVFLFILTVRVRRFFTFVFSFSCKLLKKRIDNIE